MVFWRRDRRPIWGPLLTQHDPEPRTLAGRVEEWSAEAQRRRAFVEPAQVLPPVTTGTEDWD